MQSDRERREDFKEQLEGLRTESGGRIIVNYFNLQEAKDIAKAIQGNPKAKFFEISGPIGMGQGLPRVKVLAEAFKGSSLVDLSMPDAVLGDEEVKVLAAVLKDTNIESLQLGFNPFGLKGFKALAAGLKSSKVTTLALQCSGCGLPEVKAAVKALVEVVKLGKLTFLDLQNNDIGDAAAKALASVVQQSALEELNVSENGIADEGAKALASALPGSKVRVFGVGSNCIGDAGAKALAQSLKECKVEEFHFFDNPVRDEGAQALAAALAQSSLRYLDLSDYGQEPLSKETGEAFLRGLRGAPLSTLEFGEADANFTPQVRKGIRALLKANETRTFVLQMELVQSEENMLRFQFRTLAGTVAAELDWSLDFLVSHLPEAVFKAMRDSGFQVPFKGLGEENLRIVKPDGAVMKVGDNAADLRKQLGLACSSKRAREGAGGSKPPMKRAKK